MQSRHDGLLIDCLFLQIQLESIESRKLPMKRFFLYGLLPFVPLVGLLGSSRAERPPVEDADQAPQAVQLCHHFNGTACSPPGTTFQCFNHFPDEPGLCECTTSGVWDCG